MIEKVHCDNCNASGRIQGDGYIFHECKVCKGKKYVDKVIEDTVVEPVIKQDEPVVELKDYSEDVAKELPDNSIVKKIRRRGRTPGAKNHKVTKL